MNRSHSNNQGEDGGFFRDIAGQLTAVPPQHLVVRLTLLVVLVYGVPSPTFSVAARVLTGVMLLSVGLSEKRVLWWCLAFVAAMGTVLEAYWIDNHQFLIAYWILACWLALESSNPMPLLQWNGRVIIGLVFLFATTWKFLAGEYLDGTFWHYTFLTDSRFEAVATISSGLDAGVFDVNRRMLMGILHAPETGTSVALISNAQIRLAALVLSYGVLIAEGVLAVAFLVPPTVRLSKYRDILLLLFIGCTYFLAPVVGFGSILCTIAAAQASKATYRTAYLLMIAAVQVTALPSSYVTKWIAS